MQASKAGVAERERHSRETTLSTYAKKSNAGMRKGNSSKAGGRDMFSRGHRALGAGFSCRG